MPAILSLVSAYVDLGRIDHAVRKTVVGATLDALEALTYSTYDVLIIPSATRYLRHQETSVETTSQFLHTLSNEGRLPGLVIVVLESADHAGQLLVHQVNGCVMRELMRYDAEDRPDLLAGLILQYLS